MLQTETITVEHPDTSGASMIINKSDFDPAVHKLYEPPAPKPAKPKGDQKPPEGAKDKDKPEK